MRLWHWLFGGPKKPGYHEWCKEHGHDSEDPQVAMSFLEDVRGYGWGYALNVVLRDLRARLPHTERTEA